MKQSIINLKCLNGLKRDGELIFIAIIDEDNYTLVLKTQTIERNVNWYYWEITCINGRCYEEGFEFEYEAIRYAGFDTIKYTI